MKIKKVTAVYFSPVANTKAVCKNIASVMARELSAKYSEHDFTLPASRKLTASFGPDELVVFGTPTYAGRVPNKVLPFVQTLFSGSDTPAVPIVTFGNRAYDSSLTELCAELEKNGFRTFAAGAIAGRHVFSDTLAAGRPDKADLEKIDDFARRAAGIVNAAAAAADLGPAVSITGHEEVKPYYTPLQLDGSPAKFLKAKPVTDIERCNGCGICVKVCPMGSIDPDDIALTPGICIKCQACIRKCPENARYFDDPSLLSHIAMLEKNYMRRAEPEFFFSGR